LTVLNVISNKPKVTIMSAVVSLAMLAGLLAVQILVILLLWKVIRGILVRVIRDGIVAARDYDGRKVPKGLSHNPVRDNGRGYGNADVLTDDEVRALKARRAVRIKREGK
jgi:hypothetical protein